MVASLAALILGIFGAIRFHPKVGELLNQWFEINPSHLNLIAFAVTFVIIVLIVHTASFLADKLIKAVALNFINRAAGMVFGLLVTSFIISIILMPVNAANEKGGFISDKTIENSLLYKPLSAFAPAVFPYLKNEEFRNRLPLQDELQNEDPDVV